MDVGVNYPWVKYGWDFGEAPPTWRQSSDPNWVTYIDSDLELFQSLGISVVRWVIMGDGLTYGTGAQAPHLDTHPGHDGEWRFDDPPALSQPFQTHFRMLLERFKRANRIPLRPIRLLPVLLDFLFCEPGDPVRKEDKKAPRPAWVKKGRIDVIIDEQKRRKFFARVLRPLLQISRQYQDIIYAWDMFNEPDWVTRGWHPHKRQDVPVKSQAMASFLREGIQHIRTAGFKATVGFNSRETIGASAISVDINQFHYYSHPYKKMPLASFDPQLPSIIGEFATSPQEDVWPALAATEQRVLNRLHHVKSQGYPLALLWSYNKHSECRDNRTSWTLEVERDIECFTQGRNCPRTNQRR